MESVSTLEVVLGVVAVAMSLVVIVSGNPIVSAIGLLATLFLTGGLYIAMGSFFVGAAQILIYAGAIAVLFVFIVMLLDVKPLGLRLPGRTAIVVLGAMAGLFFAAAAIVGVVQSSGTQVQQMDSAVVQMSMSPIEISKFFVSKYMVAFQMTGFLILSAIMGAILLGRPEKTGRYG